MVEYVDWVRAVHKAYKQNGGVYESDTAEEIVSIAADYWEENKERILRLAFEAAVRFAEEILLREAD